MAKRVPRLTKSGKKRAPVKWNANAAFRGGLRKAFARSPQVKAVRDKARRESNRYNNDGSISKQKKVEYRCNICGNWFKSQHTAVDHIDPVIDPNKSFEDWNTFIKRLDCDESNLQVVCSYKKSCKDKTKEYDKYSCHFLKTKQERDALKALSVK